MAWGDPGLFNRNTTFLVTCGVETCGKFMTPRENCVVTSEADFGTVEKKGVEKGQGLARTVMLMRCA